jgi:acetolactate synthase I/II/III large subunit
LTNQAGVVVVTTGPGAINTLNGVFGAWTDSIPMLIISGQVKRESCMSRYELPNLRQLGDQEVDIIGMVRSITKYAVQIHDPQTIRYHTEKALYLAENGRPGPVWIDIPLDVQSSQINPEELLYFDPKELDQEFSAIEPATITEVLTQLEKSQRPVILAGTGIRLADAIPEFEALIRQLSIPVVTAWTHDLLASDDPLFCGRPGTIGTRAGNFTVQNADLLLILGSRMNVRQTSYNWQAVAPNALKIQIDIDPAELRKPTFKPDLAICSNLKSFIPLLNQALSNQEQVLFQRPQWLARCKERLGRYPNVSEAQRRYIGKINPYHFIESLISELNEDAIILQLRECVHGL